MQVTMWSTGKETTLDGVEVRVWRGVVEGGIPVFVFVHRLAVARKEDCDEFERELTEMAFATEVDIRQVL